MAQSRLELGALPGIGEIIDLPDDGNRAEKTYELLNRLLANLESGTTRESAVALLHELAETLICDKREHLFVRSIDVPGLDKPVNLLLTPAVFSPEKWGQTFAEGLMKDPEQFDSTRVVELGTGCGWISLLLLKKTGVKEVVGLDINPVAVTIARLNAWLNGTLKDGTVLTSQAGVPIVGAFRIAQSDLLADSIRHRDEFDHIIGCIPQVLHPGGESADSYETSLKERELYDLSNYCFEQGILEDRFGLPLIARALEQSQLCLKRGGKVTLILGGRPGPDAIKAMFDRRGFQSSVVWSRRIPQADDTDLASLVSLEKDHGIKFHFFMSGNSRQSVSAETAVSILRSGKDVYHDLLVYQATTQFEGPTFGFVRNLHRMSLDALRKELDFSRMTEEQMTFLERLSEDFINHKTLPYPNERGDLSLRKRLAKFLSIYCQIPVENDSLFVAPERGQLLSMIVNMVAEEDAEVLLSESLKDVYELLGRNSNVKTTWSNDDLSEILELDEIIKPAMVVLSPVQFNAPSAIVLNALFEHARKHPERWYIIDDSTHFDIGSQLDSNMLLRITGQMQIPDNVVLLYGLIKNTVCPDLELSFLINAPERWVEGFDVAAELTYSRIPYPSQLYYEWLFDDLLSFPFPGQLEGKRNEPGTSNSARLRQFRKDFIEASKDPSFAPKPISTKDKDLIRFDYGEFEHSVPDLLVKGLIKGFVEPHSDVLAETVKYRITSYLAHTRRAMVVPDRIALAQGAFPLFGALIRALRARLGRRPRVAIPDGSYGPLYPMLLYHGAEIVPIETVADNGFAVTPEMVKALKEKPDLLWLTQPGNPSGLLYESSAVSNLLKICAEKEIYLLADEIFFLLSDYRLGDWTPHYLSFGSHLGDSQLSKYLFLVDGASKAYAAGGLRSGFLVSPDREWSRAIQSHLDVPPAAILRACDNLYSAFLEEAPHGMIDVSEARDELLAFLNQARRELSDHRKALTKLLRQHGLDDGLDTPYRGGLFLLARLSPERDRLAIEQKLLINSGAWSKTGDWSRICFSIPPARFNRGLERLTQFLDTE